ncbi:hypothetical protein, variant 3 [Aphanomyces astaci]|uniref:Major facilitator superfamily (MFS) profile domain-containing protein n=1 Tax=Aphanomyces astaci TaxID=112090 RepID=W4FH31_APHAT|nr:hypothetical protein, variant 2 [Aphanomyces astaci]XP_009843642.1 hypothetical protein, variant 3 [Aphanomyces astaci]ETV66837.1 hypothetical protein, variant 2 [Aphanomyces astaci]ETV66838.1 hypothetical protein, variant 3 [Aphanomyces astaci]|eukprot:XP_009843640.1 hypothetical protein, variant 2 [Aphanomyces astaci]
MVRRYLQQLDHNVKLSFLFTFAFWSSRSIVFEQILSGYIFVLTSSNEPVGYIKGVQGTGLSCAFLTLYALYMNHMPLLYVVFALWGLFFAIQVPALEALFADSIPQGKRAYPITIKCVLTTVATIVGPCICVVLFQVEGDSWNLWELQLVLMVGMSLGIPPLFLLFFFNDDLAYENSIKTAVVAAKETQPLVALEAPSSASNMESEHNTFLWFGPRHVPYLLFTSDFIICNGAGLTINFFPVFFQHDYNLTPSQVNLLWVAQPLLVVVLSLVCQRCATWCGDIETIVATRFFATGCLALMTYATPLSLVVALFLMRSGFMRCSEPLRTSLLMDYVPQHLRGRWNALEGLTMFTYSGSAMVGGYLIEHHGYRYCFLITAAIYGIGLLAELLLLPIIRNDPKSQSKLRNH